MKKFFKFAIIVAVLITGLAGCPAEEEADWGFEETTLTINNESLMEIHDVKWHGSEFYDLYPGGSTTRIVSPGSGYVSFIADSFNYFYTTYQTNDVVVVGKNEDVEFTFTNNTVVKDSSGNSIPLGSLNNENE
jgi:hypothetical protein